MSEQISEAIVIVDPGQPGDAPACTQDYGDKPVLVHVLRQLKSLGITHVLLSASRAHERSVRPIVAGFDQLPVCEMVAGPRHGPDSTAAAFARCRAQIDSTDLLITRASILSEPGAWLEQMLTLSASNVAVIAGDFDEGPAWMEPAWLSSGMLAVGTSDSRDVDAQRCWLSGTVALRADDADSFFGHLKQGDDARVEARSLEQAMLEWVADSHELQAVDTRKTAWLCAETTFWP